MFAESLLPLPLRVCSMPEIIPLVDSESTASYPGECPVRNDAAIWDYSSAYRGKTIIDTDVKLVIRHEIHLNHCDLGLKITNCSSNDTKDMKYLALDDEWKPSSVMRDVCVPLSAKTLLPIDGEIVGQNNNSACQMYPQSLKLYKSEGSYSSMNEHNEDRISVTVNSSDRTSAKPLIECVPNQEKKYAQVKKSSWDLNVASDACDTFLDNSIMKTGQIHGLDIECMQKEGIESCSLTGLSRDTKGTHMKLEEHITHKNDQMALLDSDDYLDLQLKLPSKPEISFDWDDAGASGFSAEQDSVLKMTQLSLALEGNCNVAKWELPDEECQLGLNISKLHSLNSIDNISANSEAFEGAFSVEVDVKDCSSLMSTKDCSSPPRRSDIGQVTLGPHEGSSQIKIQQNMHSLEGCCLKKIDSVNLTYCLEPSKDSRESMIWDLNSDLVEYDGGPCHDVPEMHLEANIETDGNTPASVRNAFLESDKMVSAVNLSPGKRGDNSHLGLNKVRDSTRLEDVGEEPISANCEPVLFTPTVPLGGQSSSSKSVPVNLHIKLSGICKPAESDGLNDTSMDTDKEFCEDYELDISNEVISATNLSLEKKADVGSIEDCEVREAMPLQNSDDEPVEQQLNRGNSDGTARAICQAGTSTATSLFDGKELQRRNSDCPTESPLKVEGNSASDGAEGIKCDGSRLRFYKKDRRERRSTIGSNPQPDKHTVPPKRGSASASQEINHGSHRDRRSRSRLWSKKSKFIPANPISPRKDRIMFGGKSDQKNKQSNAGTRRRFWNSECERSQCRPAAEQSTNSRFSRKPENRPGALQCDLSSYPNHLLQPDNPITYWPARPEGAHGVPKITNVSDNQALKSLKSLMLHLDTQRINSKALADEEVNNDIHPKSHVRSVKSRLGGRPPQLNSLVPEEGYMCPRWWQRHNNAAANGNAANQTDHIKDAQVTKSGAGEEFRGEGCSRSPRRSVKSRLGKHPDQQGSEMQGEGHWYHNRQPCHSTYSYHGRHKKRRFNHA